MIRTIILGLLLFFQQAPPPANPPQPEGDYCYNHNCNCKGMKDGSTCTHYCKKDHCCCAKNPPTAAKTGDQCRRTS